MKTLEQELAEANERVKECRHALDNALYVRALVEQRIAAANPKHEEFGGAYGGK